MSPAEVARRRRKAARQITDGIKAATQAMTRAADNARREQWTAIPGETTTARHALNRVSIALQHLQELATN